MIRLLAELAPQRTSRGPQSCELMLRRAGGLWTIITAMTIGAASALAQPLPAAVPPDLRTAYQQALDHDPDYRAAQANHRAETEQAAIARAQLGPRLALNAGSQRNLYQRQDSATYATTDHPYTSHSAAVRLTQPLYDAVRQGELRQAQERAQRANSLLADARQDLLLRLARAWYDYLLSLDQHGLAQAQLQTLREQQTQAQNLYRAGAGTITDVEETAARVALAQAQLSATASQRETRAREYTRITGQIPHTGQGMAASQTPDAPEMGDAIPTQAELPRPPDMAWWTQAAQQNHPRVLAQQAAVRLARLNLYTVQAARQPTVSLSAVHQRGRDPSYQTRRDTSSQIGLELNLTLYDSGVTDAATRQAQAHLEQAENTLKSAQADAETRALQAWWDVVNGVEQVRAHRAAVQSAEAALKGMRIGQEAGLRTNSDVLNAQQQLFAARRDLQREGYALRLARIRLALAAAQGEPDTTR